MALMSSPRAGAGSGVAGPHSAGRNARVSSGFSAVVLNGKGEDTKLGYSVRNNYTDPAIIYLCCMFSSGRNMSVAEAFSINVVIQLGFLRQVMDRKRFVDCCFQAVAFLVV